MCCSTLEIHWTFLHYGRYQFLFLDMLQLYVVPQIKELSCSITTLRFSQLKMYTQNLPWMIDWKKWAHCMASKIS
jgi:hypothetical protein